MTLATGRTDARPAWFVGAAWGSTDDQTERFLRTDSWENGWGGDHHSADLVRLIQAGDRIAIKSTYRRKYGLPFDSRGEYISTMRIKAIGIVKRNLGDGRHLLVDWTPINEKKEWYFYTYRGTVWEVRPGTWVTDQLIGFTFDALNQDIEAFRNDENSKTRTTDRDISGQINTVDPQSDLDSQTSPPYTTNDIVEEGCFLDRPALDGMLQRLETKKNLILQGPPGTGKTWLAKKLAYALIGQRNEQRVRPMQFHPNLSYEDFVRGWRPQGDGSLTLVDGPFLQVVEEARNDTDSDYVMVIEEINRGNPASIFGEMLTLLEADKRNEDEALALAYPRQIGERVYIPPNVYVIGTMNLADRSLAMVDLALRRRFAFFDLEPMLNDTWREWVQEQCGIDGTFLDRIAQRINSLNEEIAADRNLGRQFRIGHSFVTPAPGAAIEDPDEWFEQVVETEIVPLLHEYWFDNPDKVSQARLQLLGAA